MAKYVIKRSGSERYITKNGKQYIAIWENTDKAFLKYIAKDHKKPYIITSRLEFKTIYGDLQRIYTLWEYQGKP